MPEHIVQLTQVSDEPRQFPRICLREEWSFADAPLRGVYASNSVYEDVKNWDSFEPVLSQAEQIDSANLGTLTEGIPEEWWSLHDCEDLSRLAQNLFQRRSSIRDLITAFRNSTRNPFPNWAGN